LQRELAQDSDVKQHFVWSSEHPEGLPSPIGRPLDLELDMSTDKLQRTVSFSLPPRLGVLLGSPDSGDSNRILGVTPGSSAERAGLREGDRLISIDGEDVTQDTPLVIRKVLDRHKPGDSVDVLVQRGEHEELVMPVTIDTRWNNPQEFLQSRLQPMMPNIQQYVFDAHADGKSAMTPMPMGLAGLGLDTQLVNNHAGLARYFGTAEGVLVLRIAEDNPLGLQAGDVILEIDGDAVNRPVDLGRMLLGRDAGEAVTLTIQREGGVRDLSGVIPERQSTGSTSRQIEIQRLRRDPALETS
jgi:S1-C subfamily serine protease